MSATHWIVIFPMTWMRMNHCSREVFIDREKEMTAWLLRLVVPVKWGEQERVTREWGEPEMRIGTRRTQFYLSPVVGVGHVYQGIVLSQQVVPVDHVHHKLFIEPVLGDDELLQVVHSDGARALQEPSVWVVRLQAVRSLVVLPLFAHIAAAAAETDGR